MTSRFGLPTGWKIQAPFACRGRIASTLDRAAFESPPPPQPIAKRSAASTTGVRAALTCSLRLRAAKTVRRRRSSEPSVRTRPRACRLLKEADQLSDRTVAMLRGAQRKIQVNLVPVTAAVAALRDVAGLLELPEDVRCSPLGYADRLRDVLHPDGRLGGDALEDVRMVGQIAERMR